MSSIDTRDSQNSACCGDVVSRKEPLPSHRSRLNQLTTNAVSVTISFITAAGLALVPSFLIPSTKSTRSSKTQGSSNIPALDGLRGISCFFVLQHHWTAIVENSYFQITGVKNSHYFFHLPVIHLLWHGPAQVAIFFVLSGYVLSVKCLKNIHHGQWNSFQSTIASSVFRRAIRILLPPIASLIICTVLIRAGAFDYSRYVWDIQQISHSMKVEMHSVPPPYLPTMTAQLYHLLGAIVDLIDPQFPAALPGRWMQIDDHLWTIPQEYYGSMALYLALLGTSRLRCIYRLLLNSLLILYCWLAMHLTAYLFFAGLVIAELDLLWKTRVQKQQAEFNALLSNPNPQPRLSRLTIFNRHNPSTGPSLRLTCLRISILSIGLWLLSIPWSSAESTPGYVLILALAPSYMPTDLKHNMIRGIGAVLTVFAISNVSTDPSSSSSSTTTTNNRYLSLHGCTDAILCNRLSQYLGRISFALYIVHGPVILSAGYAVIPTIYNLAVPDEARRQVLATPDSAGLTERELVMFWILGFLVVAPVSVWTADVFTRLVDARCVMLGKKVEMWLSTSPSTPSGPSRAVDVSVCAGDEVALETMGEGGSCGMDEGHRQDGYRLVGQEV